MKAFLRSFWVATILSCLSDVATAAPISAVFRFEADRDLVASSPFPGNINTARELAPPGTSPNVTLSIRTRSPEARLEAEAHLLINGSLSSDRQILGRNPITLNLGGADLAYSYSTSIGAGVTVGINPDRFTVDLSNFIPANVGIPRSIGGDISNQNIIDQSFSLDSESGQGTAFGQSLRVQGRQSLIERSTDLGLPGAVNNAINTVRDFISGVFTFDADAKAGVGVVLDSNLRILGATGTLVATNRDTGTERRWTGLDLTQANSFALNLDQLGIWDLSLDDVFLSSLFTGDFDVSAFGEFDFSSSIFGQTLFDFSRGDSFDFRFIDGENLPIDFGQRSMSLGSVQISEVPLPPSGLLLGFGLAMLGVARRQAAR